MIQYRFIVNIIGLVTCALATAVLLPAIADLVANNPDWQVFVLSSVMLYFIGLLCVLSTRNALTSPLTLRSAFLLTSACWIAVPLFGALPFLGLDISYADAVFEATSGLTTTGSTILSGLDHMPPGILLWRALLQWIGGVGIIVMAIVMLPHLRVGGAQLFRMESSDTKEKAEARSLVLVSEILQIYVLITFSCAAVFWAFGMSAFDAFCHAMASVSTGGFANYDQSFGHFADWRLQWAATFFMLSGAIPFYVYIKAVGGNYRALVSDTQVRAMVALLAFTSIAMAFWLSFKADIAFPDALTLTAFNITSIVTTTGFATTDYTLWGPGAIGLFLLLTFVGGCSGSTSGGIKIYRFQVLFKVISAHLKRLVSPNRIIVVTFNGRPMPHDVTFSILAFLALFIATIALCTLALALMDLDIVTAYSASVTAITNVGPGLGPIIGPAGNFEPLPDSAKWLLSFAMILGRLEIFTLLVMLDRDFWMS